MNWSGIAPTGGAARPIRPRRSAALTESFDATVPITRRIDDTKNIFDPLR